MKKLLAFIVKFLLWILFVTAGINLMLAIGENSIAKSENIFMVLYGILFAMLLIPTVLFNLLWYMLIKKFKTIESSVSLSLSFMTAFLYVPISAVLLALKSLGGIQLFFTNLALLVIYCVILCIGDDMQGFSSDEIKIIKKLNKEEKIEIKNLNRIRKQISTVEGAIKNEKSINDKNINSIKDNELIENVKSYNTALDRLTKLRKEKEVPQPVYTVFEGEVYLDPLKETITLGLKDINISKITKVEIFEESRVTTTVSNSSSAIKYGDIKTTKKKSIPSMIFRATLGSAFSPAGAIIGAATAKDKIKTKQNNTLSNSSMVTTSQDKVSYSLIIYTSDIGLSTYTIRNIASSYEIAASIKQQILNMLRTENINELKKNCLAVIEQNKNRMELLQKETIMFNEIKDEITNTVIRIKDSNLNMINKLLKKDC